MDKIDRLTGAQLLEIARIIDDDMNWEDLDWLIDDFSERYAFDNLALDSPLEIPKTRERLKLFTISQIFNFLKELNDIKPESYFNIYSRIIELYPEELSKNNIKQVFKRFENYPNVIKAWEQANFLLETKHFREAVDNSRLAIELFFKELFKNKKSLENQKNEIGDFLKKQPKEFRDLTISHIRSYEVLQNSQFKHNSPSGIEEIEVRYILNTTYLIMDYLERKTHD
ncbi:MAG: hypothetical protein ABS916_04710 [Carnobacterium sp.]|uniref:hypothetical protein n=1 Tax=Carnobacterium sp. TaxID=48221 RepID=UPI003316291E